VVNAPRPDVLRLMPSLRASAAEIDEALAILADVLGAPRAVAAEGSLGRVAIGPDASFFGI
jgi:hypothetical protein